MATLTVRDIDDVVLERLKAAAQAHNRSVAGEVREVLAAYVAHHQAQAAFDPVAWAAGADAIAATSRPALPGNTLQDILDEIRAERS